MRAWVLNDTSGLSSFELVEIPTPEPGPGEVRVKLVSIGINHLDIWVSMGLPKPHHFPHIAGGDGAGRVDSVGEDVQGLSRGDDVIIDPTISMDPVTILGEQVDGTFGEYVVVPAGNLAAKPPELSWEVAGSFALATGTALRMLERGRLESGETLLVVGVGGGVASAAALVGVALGANVFVTSRSQEKIAWAVDHGVTAGFDSGSDYSDALKSQAGAADVVVENVGAATWDQSFRSLGRDGRLVVSGGTSGARVELKLPVLWFREIEIIGSSMFDHDQFRRALELVASGAAPIPVDSVHEFEDLPVALERLDSGRQLGKVVVSH